MRKVFALVSALLVMLASLVPIPVSTAALARASATVTVREAESLVRSLAHPLIRAAGVDAGLVRITLIQARPINAFVTTGNRLFIGTGLIQRADCARGGPAPGGATG